MSKPASNKSDVSSLHEQDLVTSEASDAEDKTKTRVEDQDILTPEDQAVISRLIWRARRGVLELDAILQPLLSDRQYASIILRHADLWAVFLSSTDDELTAYLLQGVVPPERFQPLVDLCLDFASRKH